MHVNEFKSPHSLPYFKHTFLIDDLQHVCSESTGYSVFQFNHILRLQSTC